MDSEAAGSTNCLPAGVQIGEYRVLGVIGEGGFGIVYRAKDLALDREVAIKEYMPASLAGRQSSHRVHVRSQHRGAFDAGLRSFINEARLLAQFSHPTLVHVYRFFESGGTAYMVMRKYEGMTLRRVLENPSLRIDQAWLSALLAPLLDVLELLHAEDCFHRDIAPDNILVQHDGSPVLLDFGAARRIIGDMAQALTMVLKPGFAPIEQYVDDGAMPQGAWTDIYQIGALMHLAITGKTPATSVARMVSDPMQILTPEQAPGFSASFLHGVQRALAVRPQDRPQSIAELRLLLGLSANTYTAPEPTFEPAPEPVNPIEPPVVVDIPQTDSMATVPTPSSSASSLLDGLDQSPPATASAVFPEQPQEAAPPPAATAVPAEAESASPPASVARPLPPQKSPATSGKRVALSAVALVAGLVIAGLLWFNHSQQEAKARNLAARDTMAWQQAQEQASLPRLQEYLDNFPDGQHRNDAQALIQRLIDEATKPLPPKEEVLSDPVTAQQAASTSVEPVAPPAPPATVVATQPPAPPEDAKTEPRTTSKPVAAVMGKVQFRIVPWGYVSINRAPAKTSPPLTQLELPEGEYRIDISNPGAGAAVTKTIKVKNGTPVTVTHHFE